MGFVSDDLRIVFREPVERPTLARGDMVREPQEIKDQIKKFNVEFAQNRELVQRLFRARLYRHFVVDQESRRIAPRDYALWYGATLETLRVKSAGDMKIPVALEQARLERIEESPRVYLLREDAWKTLNKICPQYPIGEDKINFHVIRQRCLVSADPVEPTKALKLKSELRVDSGRIFSTDTVLVLEELERDRLAARKIVKWISTCARDDKVVLKRNRHFALIYAQSPSIWWVFLPRRLTLSNLHYMTRNVLAEALEYIYRYQNSNKRIVIKPVVVFSSPISKNNDWVVSFLEAYGIEVYYHDPILGLLNETHSFHPRQLSWLNRIANPNRVEASAD